MPAPTEKSMASTQYNDPPSTPLYPLIPAYYPTPIPVPPPPNILPPIPIFVCVTV
ncbi:MAG TPA: hypothetical protein VEG44_02625 [Candidatus Acidoferrales bacterium]|nr:hypothetical protein [Candidatus Acidoferrales bacterium]